MKPILEIQNVFKKFRIQHERKPYLSIRDAFSNLLKQRKNKNEDFYALKDISFNVFPGECVGIIGKNGAGKSTLLKILSKITPPTSGKIISRGRIASLLEVGTGFHPELSGRENIFLNGSILGMKRKEIQNKFDEIVQFSGTEYFLDTPLKHYSSGMQLRLAFSVAAFLEPEILVIDEVLAVGDAEFQSKCIGKMEDFSKSGRTILFVSHNMGAVKNLCKKGVLLHNASILMAGEMESVSQKYLSLFNSNQHTTSLDFSKFKNAIAYPTGITIEDENNRICKTIPVGTPWQIRIKFTIEQATPYFMIGIGFKNIENLAFRTIWTSPEDLSTGNYEAIIKENKIHYGVGKYKINMGFSTRHQAVFYSEDCCILEFEDLGKRDVVFRSDAGIILNQMESTIHKL